MVNNAENSDQVRSIDRALDKTNGDSLVQSGNDIVQAHEVPEAGKKPLLRAARSELFLGPIPPPDLLAKYDKIIPNGADRILRLAEQQQNHRHYLEKTVIESDVRRSNKGLLLGFCLVLVLGVGGIYLASQGQSVFGLAIVLGPLAGLATVFVYVRNSRKRELDETRGKITKEDDDNK